MSMLLSAALFQALSALCLLLLCFCPLILASSNCGPLFAHVPLNGHVGSCAVSAAVGAHCSMGCNADYTYRGGGFTCTATGWQTKPDGNFCVYTAGAAAYAQSVIAATVSRLSSNSHSQPHISVRRSWPDSLRYFYPQLPQLGNATLVDINTLNGVGNRALQQQNTMVGPERIVDTIQLALAVLKNEIEGDWIETGVWKGGVVAVLASILKQSGASSRRLFAADSYEGLPAPTGADLKPEVNAEKAMDPTGSYATPYQYEYVQQMLQREGLLEQVTLIRGWFNETLPIYPFNKFSLLRLDGDMYESTMVALVHLYPRLNVGGVVIIDDYGHWPQTRLAVHDYCTAIGIHPHIIHSDYTGVYFVKTAADVGKWPNGAALLL